MPPKGPISYGMFDETNYGALQGKNAPPSLPFFFSWYVVCVDLLTVHRLVCLAEWLVECGVESRQLPGSHRGLRRLCGREHSHMLDCQARYMLGQMTQCFCMVLCFQLGVDDVRDSYIIFQQHIEHLDLGLSFKHQTLVKDH